MTMSSDRDADSHSITHFVIVQKPMEGPRKVPHSTDSTCADLFYINRDTDRMQENEY